MCGLAILCSPPTRHMRNPMRLKLIITFLCFASSSTSFASTCEESFSKKGNVFSGGQYSASVSLPNLSVASAIGQMRGIALNNKMDVISEDAENGSMLIEERATSIRRAVPVIISASNSAGVGTVEALLKTSPGMAAKADTMKVYICNLLNEIKSGKEGKNAAAKGKNAAASSAPTKVNAFDFSYQLAQEAKVNDAVIAPRYKGRVFTITGRVAFQGQERGFQRIVFETPDDGSGTISLPGEPYFKVGIVCEMAKDKTAYALSLRQKEKIKLTGVFSDYNGIRDIFTLKDCRPE